MISTCWVPQFSHCHRMLKYRTNLFCGAVLMGKSFPDPFVALIAKLFIKGTTYSRSHQGSLEISLCRLIRAYADSSIMESIALRTLLVMPALLLQNSNHRSKMRDNSLTLERCLKLWFDGNVDSLLHEVHIIQLRLPLVNLSPQRAMRNLQGHSLSS